MKYLCITFLVCLAWISQAQPSYRITGKVNGLREPVVRLASFYGEMVRVIDSAQVRMGGEFTFAFPASQAPGYYRVILAKDHYVDLILKQEDIRFTTDFNAPLDSLKILESNENRIYYDFLEKASLSRMKLDLLSPLIDYYPRGEPFFRDVLKQYDYEQRRIQAYIDSIALNYPSLYVSKALKAQSRPYLAAELTPEERLKVLKDNYWAEIDLSDTSLLRSTVFTNLVIDYLSLYGNRQFSQDQLEEAFIQAVDVILSYALVNQESYAFMLEYLVKGFEKYHFDKVLDHIATTYVQEQGCENEDLDSDVVTRLKNYQNLSVGKPSPGMTLPDTTGRIIDLNQFGNDYVLLVFWASWCPHCGEMMPGLKEIYAKYRPRLEMIAISIDTDDKAYRKALKEGNYPWINCTDLKGWNSKPAVDFNIYATPTMFLLDKQKVILAKPITLNELQAELNKVFNF
jgi:thiol-disulfide isomerase/thioredoxin